MRHISEIAAVFLRLGLTSFGGPVAHLGYFRDELVARRGWISDAAFAQIVALGQFLPGPASSQAGFAIGWQRGGFAGAMVATLCFTLPSAVAMVLLAAMVGTAPPTGGIAGGVIQGLKITAVAVVAHAVWGMARSLTPDLPRAAIALAALALLLVLPAGAVLQVGVIAAGALAGLALRCGPAATAGAALRGPARGVAIACLLAFAALLILLPLLAGLGLGWRLADVFYRAGALVFGGGHVVLPLLDQGTRGLVPEASFLAGYGAAQAMPGPLFTFAAWLGQVAAGLPGALIALVAVFLPGFLLMAGALPFWSALAAQPKARHLMAGANAAVVGILAHALYDPVITGGIRGPGDAVLAAGLFLLLVRWKVSALKVVAAGAAGGAVLALV